MFVCISFLDDLVTLELEERKGKEKEEHKYVCLLGMT